MTNLIHSQIDSKISKIAFSDGSSVKSRSSKIIYKNKNIGFSIDITKLDITEAKVIHDKVTNALSKLKEIEKISIVLTSSKEKQTEMEKGKKSKIHIERIKKVIIIAAGKGGVGKSTISALLAQKKALAGQKVGLLDADIYGPSIPNMFGLEGKPMLNNNRMVPLNNFGVSINSIGFLTAPEGSISWRGPMTSKALYQLISLTNWGNLDYLFIDMPPGTGDIHLSLLENYIVDGAIMVTTPQTISKVNVCRAINLYKKFNIPIIGIIENMSFYLGENSQPIQIFPGNSAQEIAIDYDIPLLTKLPINSELSKTCDLGKSLKQFTNLVCFDL